MNKLSSFLIKKGSIGKAVLPLSLINAGISIGSSDSDEIMDKAYSGGKGFIDAAVPLSGAALGSSFSKSPLMKALLGGTGFIAAKNTKDEIERDMDKAKLQSNIFYNQQPGTLLRRG